MGSLAYRGFGEDLSLAVLMPIEGKGTQIRRIVNEKDEEGRARPVKSFQLRNRCLENQCRFFSYKYGQSLLKVFSTAHCGLWWATAFHVSRTQIDR